MSRRAREKYIDCTRSSARGTVESALRDALGVAVFSPSLRYFSRLYQRMKRTQDKIKDLVEPQEFDDVRDFAADPARALAAYRFTDATSDLLARWLDALADLPRGHGAAHALAGMRGVGKSHTLATFGALIAAADEHQHAQITDAHVALSARRLVARRHLSPRRTRHAPTSGTNSSKPSSRRAGRERGLIGRATPPSGSRRPPRASAHGHTSSSWIRPSGAKPASSATRALRAICRAAREANAFVALALDDDIAGARASTSRSRGTFQIDYLEPEHLYHVANI